MTKFFTIPLYLTKLYVTYSQSHTAKSAKTFSSSVALECYLSFSQLMNAHYIHYIPYPNCQLINVEFPVTHQVMLTFKIGPARKITDICIS